MQRLSAYLLVAVATCTIAATDCRLLQDPSAPAPDAWSTVATRPAALETELTPLEATAPDAGPAIATNLSAVRHVEH